MLTLTTGQKHGLFFDVREEFRHNGVGQELIRHAEIRLLKGYYCMLVDFEEKDKLAGNFCFAHGFRRAAKIKDWFVKGTYVIIYARELPEKK